MRKQMIENAVYDVAEQVRSVEDCIEAALGEIAELQGRMVRARSVAGMGIGPSHAPFEQLAGATQALVGARGSMAGVTPRWSRRRSSYRAFAPSRSAMSSPVRKKRAAPTCASSLKDA
ncbi:MAG: hypothetical protein ABI626_06220 [Sphingomicrobium sp.]